MLDDTEVVPPQQKTLALLRLGGELFVQDLGEPSLWKREGSPIF
jgi:hypothetical protein